MSKANNETKSSPSLFLPYETKDIGDPSVVENLKEINESVETRTHCLETLRNELKKLEGIESCLDENFLLRFLRVSKFDPSKALERLKKYYYQTDVLLDAFRNCSMSIKKAESLNHVWISPYRMRNNSALIIGLNKKIDYKRFTFGERFYLEILLHNKLLTNPLNQICGFTVILDYEDFGIRAACEYTPGWTRLFLDSLLSTFPCRLCALHLVNVPSIFLSIFKMCYPFMSKKIQDRVFLHAKNDNWKILHEKISADILPAQYGGKLKDNTLINALENVKQLDQEFREVFLYGYSQTKQNRECMKILY